MDELATAGGWLTAVILGGFGLATELLRRRATRQADKERGPIDGFTALTTSQVAWQAQLLTELTAYREETEALRRELAAARRELAESRAEIAALRKQIKESG